MSVLVPATSFASNLIQLRRFIQPMIGQAARVFLFHHQILRNLLTLASETHTAHFTPRYVYVRHDALG